MTQLVPPAIDAYAEAHSWPESDLCRRLREETYRTMEHAGMLVGPLEGACLKMMTQLVRAKRVLEIGMFTGYSALCFAEALPDDGRVVTCEIDEVSAAVARRYVAQSPVGRKIEICMGPALDTLATLPGPFDLVFIDADKVNYPRYYEWAVDRLAPAGAILIDNVLWDGEVLREPPPDERTAAIRAVNDRVAHDPRVSCALLTIRDGLLVVTKRRA